MSDAPEPAALAALLGRTTSNSVAVQRVTPLSGGASSATFAVDATRGGAAWPLIFQRSAGGEPGAMPKPVQARLQQVALAHGLPVAAVVAIADPADGLGDGVVTARIEGEALAPRWLRRPEFAAARAALTGQCAAALARLHAVPLEHFDGLPLAGGSAQAQRSKMFEHYRSFAIDVPAFDLAFAWLKGELPDLPATALVHGDFRSGNLMIGPEGLRAILDWELAHLGSPAEDLGWLCVNAWRFGEWRKPVGGFGERAELYAAYAEAGGEAIDPAEAHAWEVYGTLRWGISCLQLAHDHLSGRVMSIERAAIGRRVSEVALDLLHLIGRGTI